MATAEVVLIGFGFAHPLAGSLGIDQVRKRAPVHDILTFSRFASGIPFTGPNRPTYWFREPGGGWEFLHTS